MQDIEEERGGKKEKNKYLYLIIEQFGLNRTFKAIWSNPPTINRDNFNLPSGSESPIICTKLIILFPLLRLMEMQSSSHPDIRLYYSKIRKGKSQAI